VKQIAFLGDSLDELRAFPEAARREAGHQLDRVQRGLDPDDWRPMSIIGQGVREVRIRAEAGIFRVFYIAAFAEAVSCAACVSRKGAAYGEAPFRLGGLPLS
jgi:phage-related protein